MFNSAGYELFLSCDMSCNREENSWCYRLVGLGVWLSLRVWEALGSNPGQAHKFEEICSSFSQVVMVRLSCSHYTYTERTSCQICKLMCLFHDWIGALIKKVMGPSKHKTMPQFFHTTSWFNGMESNEAEIKHLDLFLSSFWRRGYLYSVGPAN